MAYVPNQPTSVANLQTQTQLCMLLSRRISGPRLQKLFATSIAVVAVSIVPQKLF